MHFATWFPKKRAREAGVCIGTVSCTVSIISRSGVLLTNGSSVNSVVPVLLAALDQHFTSPSTQQKMADEYAQAKVTVSLRPEK